MTASKQKIKKICEYCGTGFEAEKITTRYCSHKCNSVAYKASRRKVAVELSENLAAKIKIFALEKDLSSKDYLSISEAAKLLGLNRSTIYRYVISGTLSGLRITKRTTRIKRSDLNALFDKVDKYEINSKSLERKPINEWYTLNEITENYGLKYSQIRKIINAEKFQEKRDGRFTLIAKKQIDTYFKGRGFNKTILNLSEWITLQEVTTEYGITENAAYSFISECKIPKKQQNGKRYYSKLHIDNIKKRKS